LGDTLGETLTRSAFGAVFLLASLAIVMLGLGVGFAAVYMKLSAELPPSGAALISAFCLLAVVGGLFLLARALKGFETRPREVYTPGGPDRYRAVHADELPQAQVRFRDSFGPAMAGPAIPPATAVPFGADAMTGLHADPRPDRPTRRTHRRR
jgi:hypothetical protein